MKLSRANEEKVLNLIKNILKFIGETPEITLAYNDGGLYINITQLKNSEVFTKDNSFLMAIQHVLNVVSHRGRDNNIPITLDVGGYKMKQINILKNIAIDAALKVKKTKEPVALSPMSASARRVIHMTLKDYPYITTHSEGKDPFRKVIVDIKKD